MRKLLRLTVACIVLLCAAGSLSAQSGAKLAIRGVVVDTQEPPQPVIGATVYIKGTQTGVVADVAGAFSIDAKKGDVLVFSCIGYKDMEYTVTRSIGDLSIALSDDVNVLEQAVVTGMTSQQRKHIASAVGVIDNTKFSNKPVTQMSQALQGGTTGILVQQASGAPGSDNSTIKIRGMASLVGTNPLVLVDGFEFDMNKLDPATVESVTILKDAAAASIYGAKAGGGVILITTRRGVAGAVKVNYNGYAGVQTPLYIPDMADSWEYMQYVNQVNLNTGSAPTYSDDEIAAARAEDDPISYPNTKWADLLLTKTAPITEHNISVSGGNSIGRFALSAQYLKQDGIYKLQKDSFDRFTVRANTSVNLTDNILVFVDTFVGRDTQVTPNSNIYSLIYSMPANIVAKYPRKEGFDTDYYGYYIASYMNAYAQAERGQVDTHIRDYVTINARPQWNIMPGLTLKGQVGYRLSTGMDKTNRDPYVFFNYFTGDEVVSFSMVKGATYTTRSNYWSASANLDWVKEIGGHRINLLGGWQSELNATTGWDRIALVSWYGKAYYSYKDKYLFEAGIRADGSSLFTGKYKWGYFPSVAAGWNINKEEFLKDVRWMSSWKARVSFGMLGNNNVSPYSYQSLINSAGTETKNGNPDLKWETVKIFDAGMDLSLFNYTLDINLDYYHKITDDLIMSLPSTLSSGLLSTPANVGKAQSRGFEIGVSYNKDFNKDTHLTIGGGFSYNRNKWLYIPGGEFITGNTICRQGHAIRANYFYVADGLLTQEDLDNYVAIVGGYPDNGVTTQQAGDIKYKDINGDGIIDTNDRTAVGDQDPHTMFYGNLTFRWRNFDIDTQFTGQGNSNGFYYGQFIQPLNSTNNGAVQRWQLDYWTPENPNASRPRPTTAGTSNEYLSTYWMFNRAFLRVKYVQLGYSFPKLASRIKASNLRVYANVQNALTFAYLKESDPETCASNNGGAVTSKYPLMRTWTVGVNLSF